MIKRAFIAIGALTISAIVPAFAQETSEAAAPDVQSIVERASAAAYYQGKDGRATVRMSILDTQGRERTRDFIILRSDIGDVDNGEQRFYVLFNRPADISKTAFLVLKHADANDFTFRRSIW